MEENHLKICLQMIRKIFKNIKESWRHIPYTLKHRKKLIELSLVYLGKRKYWFHDLDKVVMYILIPYVGTKVIHKIHATLSSHHVRYYRGISRVDKTQAILDWESARFTKPDKPQNASETLISKYPDLIPEFIDTLEKLGLLEQFKKAKNEQKHINLD